MEEKQVTLTKDELNRMLTVFSNVHKDNDANEKEITPADIQLSQVEVDSAFAKGSRATPEKPGKADEAQIRAQKIAARKAHSAQILAQVNACSPKRLQVSYGSCLKKSIDIDKLKEDDVVELDRKMSEDVQIFVDGKLFATGVLGENAGVATVKLTKIVAKATE